MTKGVFIHRVDSIYDDVPSSKYQFPPQYLSRARQCVGDWIIYYEPRKVSETRGYFAVAKVQEIIPDPGQKDMYLAIIEEGSYLDFGRPVPFREGDSVVERGVLNDDGRISGRAQAAVRTISNEDFARIISLGVLTEEDAALPREGDRGTGGFADRQSPFVYEEERQRIPNLGSRAVRDRNFRQTVLRAYGERCAVSGIRLINGGGRAEVQAAHIRPVEENGPDLVSNGIALSGTCHWMFDRGLIGIGDDLTILVSRQVNDPESVRALINRDGRMIQPERLADRPHPSFLAWHRENRFKT